MAAVVQKSVLSIPVSIEEMTTHVLTAWIEYYLGKKMGQGRKPDTSLTNGSEFVNLRLCAMQHYYLKRLSTLVPDDSLKRDRLYDNFINLCCTLIDQTTWDKVVKIKKTGNITDEDIRGQDMNARQSVTIIATDGSVDIGNFSF